MALRGVQPKAVEKRLKALFFGPAGVGKTTASIQFPRPYLIDTERGAENDQYVKLLNQSGGAYFFTSDFEELVNEVTSLLTEKHEYRTVIIDPLTVIYSDLLAKSAKSLATKEDPTGTAFSRHKGLADRQVKHLLSLLLRLDMSVIITAHAKTQWEKVGSEIVDRGQTFDCYAKLDYLFDLVYEIQKRGKERVGIVRKTRVDSFPEGDVFPFCYQTIAERYGHGILEKVAEAQELASKDQIAKLTRLIDVLKIDSDQVEKWLDKAQAAKLSEMPSVTAQKCIDWCESKISGSDQAPAPKKGNGKIKDNDKPEVRTVAEAQHAV